MAKKIENPDLKKDHGYPFFVNKEEDEKIYALCRLYGYRMPELMRMLISERFDEIFKK